MSKPGKAEKSAARSARLAAALRENLKRRKAQAKERGMQHARVPEAEQEKAEAGAPGPEFRRNRSPQ